MIDFSIITVVKNAKKLIHKNMNSVLNQRFKNYEHIIIINSKDKYTINLLKNISNKRLRIFVFSDKGPYYAMNLGLKKAKGKYFTFLNADDYFYNNKVLELVKKNLKKHPKFNSFYGNVKIIKKNKIFRNWNAGEFSLKKFFLGWHPPHPSLFIKLNKKMIKTGIFNTGYRIAADYDFMIRFFVKEKNNSKFINHTMVSMRHGGLSSKNLKNIFISNIESCLSWWKNGYYLMFYIFFLKPLVKIKQLI